MFEFPGRIFEHFLDGPGPVVGVAPMTSMGGGEAAAFFALLGSAMVGLSISFKANASIIVWVVAGKGIVRLPKSVGAGAPVSGEAGIMIIALQTVHLVPNIMLEENYLRLLICICVRCLVVGYPCSCRAIGCWETASQCTTSKPQSGHVLHTAESRYQG